MYVYQQWCLPNTSFPADGDQAVQNTGLWLWTDDECSKSLVQLNTLKQM
jgi:hypothetical protein